MGALTSPRAYRLLAAFLAADAALFVIPAPFIVKTLDTIDFPQRHRWIFAPIKVAAAIGLLSVTRFPALARLTTAMLTLYFVLAVGFHVRARDVSSSAATAAALSALFAAMTVKGPSG
jgi:DoxX-like family